MLVISAKHSVADIYRELVLLSGEKNPLEIKVEGLCDELKQKPNLLELVQKLKLYSRPITWQTSNPEVYDLFMQSNLPIVRLHLPKSVSGDYAALVDTSLSNQTAKNGYHSQVISSASVGPTIQDIAKNQPDGYFRTSSPEADREYFRQKIQRSKEALSSINQPASNSFNQIDQISNQIKRVNVLLDQEEQQSQLAIIPDSSALNPKHYRGDTPERSVWSRPVWYLAGLLVLLVGAGLMILVAFPTLFYTVQVQPEQISGSEQLVFTSKELEKVTEEFEFTVDTIPTGAEVDQGSTRPQGSVRLLNSSANDLSLSLDRFYLLQNGIRYNFVVEDGQTTQVSIPARNNESGLEVQLNIESGETESQPDPDLQVGDLLTPVNLQGVQIGKDFTAQIVEPIVAPSQESGNLVTEGDLRTLNATAESRLAELQQQRINALLNEVYPDHIGFAAWSQNQGSEFNASHQIGEAAEQAELQVEVTTDLYLLPVEAVTRRILAQDPKSDQVVRIAIKNLSQAWSEQEEALTLDLDYQYTLRESVSRQRVLQIAQEYSPDTTEVANQLKQEFEEVAQVTADRTGFPFPWLDPRVKVEIETLLPPEFDGQPIIVYPEQPAN